MAECLKYDSPSPKETDILPLSREDSQSDIDAALMQRVSGRRDALAYRNIVERHINRSLGFVERMVGNRTDAEDIVQEGFLSVWKGAQNWQPKAKFTTWFHRILYNLAIDHMRKHASAKVRAELDDEILSPMPNAEQSAIAGQRRGRVRDALQKLPERQRAALILFYYEGLNQIEAAGVLEVSQGAFEALVQRARAALGQMLDADLKIRGEEDSI
ncbi:MAG: sigma-70 family RNA polymerase sigma factor [Deltaproteobacteria bacterium]